MLANMTPAGKVGGYILNYSFTLTILELTTFIHDDIARQAEHGIAHVTFEQKPFRINQNDMLYLVLD